MNIIFRQKNGHARIELRLFVLLFLAISVAAIYSFGCDSLFAVPHIEVDPQSLHFEAVEGGAAPAAQNFAVTCELDTEYSRYCDASIIPDQAWITVDKTLIDHFGTVSVTVNPTGLAPGTYTGKVDARNDQISFDDQKKVDIYLVITAAPAP